MTARLEENELCWKSCIHCALTAHQRWLVKLKVFISRLKQDFPSVDNVLGLRDHSLFFFTERLRYKKTIPPAIRSIMNSLVATVNYIRTRGVKTRLLKATCQEAGTLHEILVLHADIRWLSKGKVFSRCYGLKNELLKMCATNTLEFSPSLKTEHDVQNLHTWLVFFYI